MARIERIRRAASLAMGMGDAEGRVIPKFAMVAEPTGGTGVDVFWDRYLPAFESWWADLGQPKLTPQLVAKLVAGVADLAGGRSAAELAAERDEMILKILEARRGNEAED